MAAALSNALATACRQFHTADAVVADGATLRYADLAEHAAQVAAQLRQASDDDLGELGIVRQRQHAIRALAAAVADGQLALNPSADVPATLVALQALPGIGAWTAHYIAMRALRWPDAFVAGDVAVQKALAVRSAKHPAKEAQAASQAWRPWRSYAVIRAWASAPSTPHRVKQDEIQNNSNKPI